MALMDVMLGALDCPQIDGVSLCSVGGEEVVLCSTVLLCFAVEAAAVSGLIMLPVPLVSFFLLCFSL